MIIVPDGYYSLNAASKEITLLSPYNNVTAGMIKLIVNLTGKETLYDAEVHTGSSTRITMADSIIHFQVGTNLRDTDKLTIVYESAKIHGGTSRSRTDLHIIRNDTSQNWGTAGTILDQGELGKDNTTSIIKMGDGLSTFANLRPVNNVPRNSTVVVAASNSHTYGIQHADYICDGTADEVQINQALDDLKPTGGRVVLLEGTYSIASSILPDELSTGAGRYGDKIELSGASNGAILEWAGTAGGTIIEIQSAWNFTMRNVTLDGNSKSGNGVYIYGAEGALSQRNALDRINIIDCDKGLIIGGGGDPMAGLSSYHDIWIDTCNTGIYLDSNNNDQTHFHGGGINGCTNAIYGYQTGVVYFNNMEIVSCATIVRKRVVYQMHFTGITEENNTTWITNENEVSTCENPLTFTNCLLQAPISITPASFVYVKSSGCRLNSNVTMSTDAKWISIGDKIAGTINTGTYGTFHITRLRNRGTATVTGSVSSVTVVHGYHTPTVITVTPLQMGSGNFAVTARTATEFTISFENQPGASTWSFNWVVEY